MDRSAESALGIAALLASGDVEPLLLQVKGMAIGEAAFPVRAMGRECGDASISLYRIVVDHEMCRELDDPEGEPLPCALRLNGEPGEVLVLPGALNDDTSRVHRQLEHCGAQKEYRISEPPL